jgi:DNA polymerase-3 subunit epsilon
LDTKTDRVIEIAIAKFSMEQVVEQYETLVNPECPISIESIKIHHITDDMVKHSPLIRDVLPKVLDMIGSNIIVGHGIQFDIEILHEAAKRCGMESRLLENESIDTLRMARNYGQSPQNSLEILRKHFNIPDEGAHRAMSDVIVNIDVFRKLMQEYKDLDHLKEVLSKPIRMQRMPLGKHKGRLFKDIPLEYLKWAANKDFDQDLLYSIRYELKRRKQQKGFGEASNPFQEL